MRSSVLLREAKYRTGIYRIRNIVNDDSYIGRASYLKHRRTGHERALRNNRHDNAHLQNAFNKYGESAFVFESMLICSKQMLRFYEQLLIDELKPKYNIHLVSMPVNTLSRQKPLSDERKQQISQFQKGRPKSLETRQRMSEARKGIDFRSEDGKHRHQEAMVIAWKDGRCRGRAVVDLTGKRINQFVVVEKAGTRRRANGLTQTMWRCRCDCGTIFERCASDLPDSKSCGCSNKESIARARSFIGKKKES